MRNFQNLSSSAFYNPTLPLIISFITTHLTHTYVLLHVCGDPLLLPPQPRRYCPVASVVAEQREQVAEPGFTEYCPAGQGVQVADPAALAEPALH